MALAAGCGGPPRVVPTVATGPTLAPPPDPTTIDAVFILESGGPPADDTTVTVTPGQTRVLLLRRGPPDNSLFATLTLSDSTPGGRPTRVHVRPRPGQYAVDLEAEGPWPSQATLSMSYALHFVAPAGSRERFGNDLGFERALFLARAEPTGRIEFLRTARPGSDLLQAAIPGPGRYIVAAPRN